MDGMIFNIQRYSLHDGAGIRTTVFFKGCNLRCKWCHNPESQSKTPELAVYQSKCVGCGNCQRICDNTFTKNCTACGKCVGVCEHGAREIIGKRVSVNEAMDTVIKDKDFYEASGGGVTLSGGEPLLQLNFALEILRECKNQGVGTAVETAGNVPFESFEKVLPYVDLFLFDIKGIDEKRHKENTGVSNKRILENAKKLISKKANILFRTPVVIGYNDSELGAISDFLSGQKWELLAYHEIGKSKYNAIGKPELFINSPLPTKSQMEDFAKGFGADYNPTGF